MFPIRTSVPNREIPAMVIALIIANFAIFSVQAGLSETDASQFLHEYGLIPERIGDFQHTPFFVLTILSSTFLHGGIFHLAVNMWTLWLFGPALESRFGAFGFLGFYLICGICAGLAHLFFNLGSAIPAVGASGAIAGVLGGFTLLHIKARITLVVPVLIFPLFFTLPAALYTAFWFGFQVIPGLLELDAAQPKAGIAWWAHIGGLVAGMVFARVMPNLQNEKQVRSGRLDISLQAGHRPRTIEFGGLRDDTLNAGQQRPTVIRLGKPRKSQPSSSASDVSLLPHDLPNSILHKKDSEQRPAPDGHSSIVPITEPNSHWTEATTDAASSEPITEKIWKSKW